MAYKDKFEGEAINPANQLSHFWNIHENVGWGCRNRPDDVMLVQFLLKGAIRLYLDQYKGIFKQPTKNDLVVDGIFGPQTHKWIKAYQSIMPGYFHQDGKVDAIDGTREYSTKQHRLYTIVALNGDFSAHYVYFHDLRMDPNLPSALAQALTQSMGSDPVIWN